MDVNNSDNERTALLSNSTQSLKDRRRVLFPCISARHTLAFLAFLGFINVYCMRVNLSVALVAMVNSTKEAGNVSSHECPDPNGGNHTLSENRGEFNWDEKTQGYILGSFFYGYILTQLPGGWMASRFGAKNLFGFGVLCTAVLTIVTPFAARAGIYAFIIVRVLEGLGEGVTFPAMHAMWGNWAPVLERSKLTAFAYAGSQIGTVIALPISGILCDSDIAGGWPSVFYLFGSLGCVWFVVWMLLAHNTPATHPRITQAERNYIENSIGQKEKLDTPWIAILTSPAVWGVAAAHFANNWGFYTLLTCLPSYMKNILRFNLKENGTLSALPYFGCWIMQNLSGIVADVIRRRRYLSTKNTRKVFNTIALIMPSCFLIIVGYVGCDHILAVVFLTLSVALGGIATGGFGVNHLDIAPRFAGILMGITNGCATIPGFAGPAVVGVLTNHNQTRHQWQIVFFITAGVSTFGAIMFLLLAQGHEQPWARAPAREITVEVAYKPIIDQESVNTSELPDKETEK